MARRRGAFGRRRGRSSSIAALVVNLMREQRQTEDRAIFDAYTNGGKFQGKVVTDTVILDYIEGRRNMFDRADPMWDEWNNRLTQQKFSIGEQKIGLAFKEGKASAGAVANFYREQLKSIPRNSAFYREVAERASQWAKAATGAARARARGRAIGGRGGGGVRDRLNAEVQKGNQYLSLERALTDYAMRIGLIQPGDKLADADATDLQEMFNRGIYTDAQQQDRLTFAEFQSAAKGYYTSLNRQVDLQIALGNQGVEAAARRDRHLYNTMLKLNAVDDRAGYELLRERWLADVEAAKGDPYAIAEANKKYSAGLKTIFTNANKPEGLKANDPEFVAGIRNEINVVETGKSTGKTVAEQYGEEGDSKDTAEAVSRLAEDLKLLDNDKAYYGQTEPGGAFGVVKWPEGLGGDPLGLDDSLQVSVRTINGVRREVYMKGKEITASVIFDTQTGEAVPFDVANVDVIREGIRSGRYEVRTGRKVGYTFTDPTTGKKTYGIPDPVTGKMVFTEENPFASDVVGIGGEDTVFGTGLVDDGKGDPTVDPSTLLKQPVSLATGGAPVLSDGTLAAKDILNLLNQGKIDVDESDLAAYRARLERDARNQSGTMTRDRWYEETPTQGLGDSGSLADSPSERTRDARDAANMPLPNIQSLRQPLQSLFAMRDKTKDDLYVPPPPPKPPVPSPPSAPVIKPKPPSAPKPKPKPVPKPSVGGGSGAGGSFGPNPPNSSGSPDDRNKPKPKANPIPIYTGIPYLPSPSGSGGGF